MKIRWGFDSAGVVRLHGGNVCLNTAARRCSVGFAIVRVPCSCRHLHHLKLPSGLISFESIYKWEIWEVRNSVARGWKNGSWLWVVPFGELIKLFLLFVEYDYVCIWGVDGGDENGGKFQLMEEIRKEAWCRLVFANLPINLFLFAKAKAWQGKMICKFQQMRHVM